MDRQGIFDTVARHLLTQQEKALNENGFCVYLDEAGRKCALGCLIPDGHPAQHDHEPATPSDLHEEYGFFEKENIPFLNALQRIHDNNPPYSWKARLGYLAVDYNLSEEVLNEF